MSALPSPTKPLPHEPRLNVSRFDHFAALLIALLILFGTAVPAMFFLLMASQKKKVQEALPVTFLETGEGSGRGDHEAGTARDKFNSQVEELDDFLPPDTTERIESVGLVISTDVTMLDNISNQSLTSGGGVGRGDSRPPGPEGEGGGDVVPRWERWQVRFASADLDAYAKQLDHFGIELAAIGGGKDTVDYAADLSLPAPRRRAGKSADEKRLYMTWRTGELIGADKALLAKAGVDTSQRVVLQLYPPQIENVLAGLEQKQAGTRNLKEIKRTVFGIRGKPGAYEFYVINQEYRFAP